MNLKTQEPVVATLGVLETAAVLRELTANLITVTDFDEALARLVRTTRDAVPGVAWCGFTVLRAGEPAGVAASEPRLAELDGTGHGPDAPGLTAIRHRELVLAEDLLDEPRWPAWTRSARTLGVRMALSAPVDIDDHVIGALNLYAGTPRVLPAQWQLTAMLIAEQAGLLLAGVRDRARQAALVGELDESLIGDGAVSQAIGVIMTQRGCPAPDALQVLRSAAEALSIPLRDVADRLLTTVSRPREN